MRHAEVASPGASLSSVYGETGLPMSQNPPLGLAVRVRRKGVASTFGTRSTAGVAVTDIPSGCLTGFHSGFLSGFTALALGYP